MAGKRNAMHEVLWIAGVLVGWLLLQIWILPKLGVST
jgi:hypothetical protein